MRRNVQNEHAQEENENKLIRTGKRAIAPCVQEIRVMKLSKLLAQSAEIVLMCNVTPLLTATSFSLTVTSGLEPYAHVFIRAFVSLD